MYEKSFWHTDCHSSLDIVYLLYWLPPCPSTLLYCLTVKQAFGNLGLLAGYGAKPIGAGLGRDKNYALSKLFHYLFYSKII